MLLGSKNNCNAFRTSWNEYQHLYAPNSYSFKYMLKTLKTYKTAYAKLNVGHLW